MAVNPAAATAYIVELLNLLAKKKSDNEIILGDIKKNAKIIGGVPFIQTGLEDLPLDELIRAMNSSFGGLAPISITKTPSLPSANLTSDTEEEDTLQILQTKSSIEDTAVTACPIDSPVVLPKYTKDEIEKVAKDVSDDCEIRSAVSPLIEDLSVNEVLDAKCDIEEPAVVQQANFLEDFGDGNNNAGDGNNNAGDGNNNANLQPEPENSLKKPIKTLVILNTTKGLGPKVNKQNNQESKKGLTVAYLDKKEGKDVDCGNPILKIGDKVVTAPVSGFLKKIYVTDIASKNDKLFLIEERSPNDVIDDVIKAAEDLTTKITQLNNLKDQLGKLEPRVWTIKQIWGVYEGQYLGFKYFYDRLFPLVTALEEVTAQLIVLNTTEIQNSKVEIESKIELIKQEQLSITFSQLNDINETLSTVIKPFTNDILLYNKTLSGWDANGGTGYDINVPSAFEFYPLQFTYPEEYGFTFSPELALEKWEGSMWKVRKDFYDKAKNFGNEIQGIEDSSIVETKCAELKAQEKSIVDDVKALADESFNKVVEFSKNYGYYQLGVGSLYTSTSNNPELTIKSFRDAARNDFETVYAQYNDILEKIAETEKEIDDFPEKLQDITSGGCNTPDISAPTSGKVDGEEVNIVTWPAKELNDEDTVKDDDNYKGNPQPNSPPITDIKYWKKYCQKATLVNLLPIYWPIGLLIPTPGPLIKIPLPIIWKPIVVVPTPLCVIVIGIAICGICPAPFVYIVNPGWPFPIGMVAPKSSWFVTGIRGPKKIDEETTSAPLAAIPTLTVPLPYIQNGEYKEYPIKIDAAPPITKLLPLIQDDLPPYERLSLTNLPYVIYLTKWCSAGKKTMGFFENP